MSRGEKVGARGSPAYTSSTLLGAANGQNSASGCRQPNTGGHVTATKNVALQMSYRLRRGAKTHMARSDANAWVCTRQQLDPACLANYDESKNYVVIERSKTIA